MRAALDFQPFNSPSPTAPGHTHWLFPPFGRTSLDLFLSIISQLNCHSLTDSDLAKEALTEIFMTFKSLESCLETGGEWGFCASKAWTQSSIHTQSREPSCGRSPDTTVTRQCLCWVWACLRCVIRSVQRLSGLSRASKCPPVQPPRASVFLIQWMWSVQTSLQILGLQHSPGPWPGLYKRSHNGDTQEYDAQAGASQENQEQGPPQIRRPERGSSLMVWG